jgi:hypothetical protein
MRAKPCYWRVGQRIGWWLFLGTIFFRYIFFLLRFEEEDIPKEDRILGLLGK